MVSISDYLKDWYNTTRSIVMHPRSFFREMPVSGSLRGPVEYMLVTTLIASLLTIPMFLVIMADGMKTSLTGAILLSVVIVVFLLISIGISLPMNALFYHLLLKIIGAKGNLEATIRVYCYYMAAGIVIMPAFGIMMMLSYTVDKSGIEGFVSNIIPVGFLLFLTVFTIYFSFYVLTVGFSAAHGISMKRVFLGIFGIPIALSLVLIALPMLLVFSTGFSSESSGYSDGMAFDNYDEYGNTMVTEYEDLDTDTYAFEDEYEKTMVQKYTDLYPDSSDIEPTDEIITAPFGSTPIVDGFYTQKDRWDETEFTEYTSEGVEYTIAAKHDSANIYILIKWEGEPTWENSIGIYFEQDGDSHDHDLETGRDDYKYNGAEVYGPSNFADAHNGGDVREEENGMVAGNYSDGFWVQEWVVPLRSGDPGDIYVEHLPSELGFLIVDQKVGTVWPPECRPNVVETWGNLEII